MHTYQREPNKERARSWTDSFRQADETCGNCFLSYGQYKSSYRFHSSKTKQQDEYVKESATEKKWRLY